MRSLLTNTHTAQNTTTAARLHLQRYCITFR